jgi:hypothetical protein
MPWELGLRQLPLWLAPATSNDFAPIRYEHP